MGSVISLNGALVAAEAARIDPTDRGFTLGDGVFETIAVRRGKVPRLAAHLARLRQGLKVLGLVLARSDDELVNDILRVLSANTLATAAVRVTVTRGVGERGIVPPEKPSPTVIIAASPFPPDPEPARLVIANSTRRNQHSPLARIKSLNYLDSILARQEAVARGADDALLLNTDGNLACGTVANVFLLVDGVLITPRIEDGALPGIARAQVIALARAEACTVPVETVARASEIFLTNALGLRPVISVDGSAIGDGAPGLITQLLATRV